MIYQPKVSIVIPAYNASNYLSQAIESALNQTYKNIEIIVVNDGSNDDGATERLALSYGDKIRYFSKPNGGSSSALNVGIENMSGEWFSWLSHDDLYRPRKIERELEELNKLIADGANVNDLWRHVCFAPADLIDAEGKIIKKAKAAEIKRTSRKINCEKGSLNLITNPVQCGFHGCSCLIHKSVFQDIGAFNERLRLLNDSDFWFRLYTNGYKIHFIPEVLVSGRVHAKQVSKSIGFSYHNAEQDMFWSRSLRWLEKNQPDNYGAFYTFGKNAYLKTRSLDGKKAFDIASKIKKNKKMSLHFKALAFRSRAAFHEFAKKVYLSLFVNSKH